MKRLTLKIREHFTGYEPYLLLYSAAGMLMVLAYRILAYGIAGNSHPGLRTVPLPAYLYYSAAPDFLAAFIIILTVSLAVALTPFMTRFRWLPGALVVTIAGCFHVFALQFLAVYETTLQRNFFGSEQFSGLDGMLASALAELRPVTVFGWIGVVIVALVLAVMAGHLRERAVVRLSGHIAAVVLLAFTALGSMAPVRSGAELLKRYPDVDAPLAELVQHPLSALLFPHPEAKYVPPKSGDGFRSDSLDTKNITDLSGLIPKGRKYNVVLYLFESTAYRYLNLSVDGKPVVPVMQRLMQNGFVAHNHIANYPLSANALFTIMSSTYPMLSKDMVFEKNPGIAVPAVTELVKDAGYRTGYMHTGELGYANQKAYLKRRKIDRFVTYNELKHDPVYGRKVGWGIDERAMIEPAVEFMKKDGPFFLVMSPVNPHHPYAYPDDSFRIARPAGDTPRDRLFADYLNSLHFADHAMGMLIDRMEAEGLMENTLFIMLTDHGEAFYQHPMNYNHPLYVYDENIHVPMIIYNKSLFPERYDYHGITRHIDILPTITDLLGIPDATKREGLPIFAPRREQLALAFTTWKDEYLTVRDRRWKYIFRPSDGSEELYDLAKDGHETANVAAAHPDIAARYRAVVEQGAGYISAYHEKLKRR